MRDLALVQAGHRQNELPQEARRSRHRNLMKTIPFERILRWKDDEKWWNSLKFDEIRWVLRRFETFSAPADAGALLLSFSWRISLRRLGEAVVEPSMTELQHHEDLKEKLT